MVKGTYYLTAEQVKKVKEIAREKGYVVQRGDYTGEGSVTKLLAALADGELTAIKLARKVVL